MGDDQHLIQALEEYIPKVMALKGTPGLNIALVRRRSIIWEQGFGYADVEKKIPMTTQTVTHSGSMGKAYTAVAVMQLVDQGVLELETPVNHYLKEFQVINPFGKREVTVKDLLTHQSGLNMSAAGSTFAKPKSLGQHLKQGYQKEYFESYQGTWLTRWRAPVGHDFMYSNFGIATLGYLVEIMNPDGLSFSDYVQTRIMDPLGMTSSQYPPIQDRDSIEAEIFERMSTGYSAFGAVHFPTPTVYFADYPAGTAVTTPGDHVRLLLALMNGGTWQDFSLLSSATVNRMLESMIDASMVFEIDGLHWGLGFQLLNVGDINFCFGHAGAHMFGWQNDFRAYPGLDFAIAVFTNHWVVVPGRSSEANLIREFVENWIKDEGKPGRSVNNEKEFNNVDNIETTREWAWKISYVIGLVLVENINGYIGVESPIDKNMVEKMIDGAFVHKGGEHCEPGWDPDGFRSGIQDMSSIDMTFESIERLVSSGELKVNNHELEKIGRQLGVAGSPLMLSATRSDIYSVKVNPY